MTVMPDANAVLMGGAKSAVFERENEWVGGRIVSDPQAYHVREYVEGNPGGGALAYYPSGDPIIGIKMECLTAQRDPMVPNDNGRRTLWLGKSRQLSAVREAVRKAGAEGLAKGGELYVAWVGTENTKQEAKMWSAQYNYAPPPTAVPGGSAPQNVAPAQQYSAPPPAQQYAPPGLPMQPSVTAVTQPTAPPIAPPATPTAAPPAAPASGRQQINATQAAAMANAGIDVSLFDVVG